MASARLPQLMLLVGLLIAPNAVHAGSFAYRGACPDPMDVSGTEAYLCRTMDHQDLGKRVDAAYQAQVAHIRTMYDKPADAEKLKQELDVIEASQKGWQTYVANQCAAEGYMAWGGSLEPKLVWDCSQRLTELRIKELEMLLDGLGN